jgi:DNA-binding NtrC family response regulator
MADTIFNRVVDTVVGHEGPIFIWTPLGSRAKPLAQEIDLTKRRVDQSFLTINLSEYVETEEEKHLWTLLKGIFDAPSEYYSTIFFDGFSTIDSILQASLLDWLSQKSPDHLQIIFSLNQPVAKTIERLPYYQKAAFMTYPEMKYHLPHLLALAEKFVADANSDFQKNISGISFRKLNELINRNWIGGEAELEARLKLAVAAAPRKENQLA